LILGIDQFGARLKEQYDKVIAFVVLLFLLSSFVYLGVQVGLIRQKQNDFDEWLRSRRALHPHAAALESGVYQTGKQALAEPFQLPSGVETNGFMFVPETRFSCRECRLPVFIDAEKCPFCDTVKDEPPPPNLNADDDGDGMPTVWEIKYGLDPFDPSDAAKDNDSDGYSNLIEFTEGFDPTDDGSHPAAVEELKLVSITGKRFALRFNSRLKISEDQYKFGLNYKLPTGETKTDFVKLGDTVAGFKLTKYEFKQVMVEKPFKHKADLSELTLMTKDGEFIVLVKGKARLHVELTAHLSLTLRGGEVKEHAVKKDATFELDGVLHKVIAIDAAKQRVVIRDERNQKEIVVKRADVTGADTAQD
jgi:hypothetical protein